MKRLCFFLALLGAGPTAALAQTSTDALNLNVERLGWKTDRPAGRCVTLSNGLTTGQHMLIEAK